MEQKSAGGLLRLWTWFQWKILDNASLENPILHWKPLSTIGYDRERAFPFQELSNFYQEIVISKKNNAPFINPFSTAKLNTTGTIVHQLSNLLDSFPETG